MAGYVNVTTIGDFLQFLRTAKELRVYTRFSRDSGWYVKAVKSDVERELKTRWAHDFIDGAYDAEIRTLYLG